MATTTSSPLEHTAAARVLNIPVSTKQCVELSNALRFHSVLFAKNYLKEVIVLKKAVPYIRATKDLGHKRGMGPARFPQKAAREFLRLVKSVEANAQGKGLNIGSLKITKLIANKASIPRSAGRLGRGTKRTHVEIQVQEGKAGSKSGGKQTTIIPSPKQEAPKATVPVPTATLPKPTTASAPKSPPEVDLVKIAKQRAARMQQQAKEQRSLEEVSELYEELKKKGSLRGKGEQR